MEKQHIVNLLEKGLEQMEERLTGRLYLLNAFSLNMISTFPVEIKAREIGKGQARFFAETAQSAVGHADIAAVFSAVLGMTIPANRATVALNKGDRAVVGQYRGPRLPEGATMLPEGATIQWLLIEIR